MLIKVQYIYNPTGQDVFYLTVENKPKHPKRYANMVKGNAN